MWSAPARHSLLVDSRSASATSASFSVRASSSLAVRAALRCSRCSSITGASASSRATSDSRSPTACASATCSRTLATAVRASSIGTDAAADPPVEQVDLDRQPVEAPGVQRQRLGRVATGPLPDGTLTGRTYVRRRCRRRRPGPSSLRPTRAGPTVRAGAAGCRRSGTPRASRSGAGNACRAGAGPGDGWLRHDPPTVTDSTTVCNAGGPSGGSTPPADSSPPSATSWTTSSPSVTVPNTVEPAPRDESS